MGVIGHFIILLTGLKILKMDDFGENGKAIALLFGEKLAFLDIVSFSLLA